MGKVYSPELVQGGGVSLVPHHREAGAYLLNALFDEQNDELFESAMIYGSTVDGPGPTIRSDLDVLVIRRLGEAIEKVADKKLADIIGNIEHGFRLSVEPKSYTAGAIDTGVDPMYAEHIVEIGTTKTEWCVNSPAEAFTAHILEPEDQESRLFHTFDYLEAKAESFDTALEEYVGFADHSYLQRAFELPSAIGRKVLPATKLPGEALPHISDKAGMRALVEQRIRNHFGNNHGPMLQNMHTLVALDGAYTSLLEDTLEQQAFLDVTPALSESKKSIAQQRLIGEYAGWLEDNYRESCERAEQLSRGWAIVVERAIIATAPHRITEIDGYNSGTFYGGTDYT